MPLGRAWGGVDPAPGSSFSCTPVPPLSVIRAGRPPLWTWVFPRPVACPWALLACQATPEVGSQVSNEPATTWIFFDPSRNHLHFMWQME